MIKEIVKSYKSSKEKSTFFAASISALISFAYALYNGTLGVLNKSLWNGSICIYYLLLLSIWIVLMVQSKRKSNKKHEKIIVIISLIMMLIVTVAMIAPAVLLILNRRDYDLGLIPAIVMAAYATYSITTSIINFSKVKENDSIIKVQIRLINMVTALMSIIVLQNTLILASGGMDENMQILFSYTTFAILISIIVLLISVLIKHIKKLKHY